MIKFEQTKINSLSPGKHVYLCLSCKLQTNEQSTKERLPTTKESVTQKDYRLADVNTRKIIVFDTFLSVAAEISVIYIHIFKFKLFKFY